jgi:competence protein ComEA
VARATVRGLRFVFDRPVEEIVVEDGWRARIESLARRRRDVWVVAVVIVALVLGALALKWRSPAPRIAPPARAPTVEASRSKMVIVHVAGAVRNPGVYELEEGDRVADAIEVAGGPRRGADLGALNLAEVVADGTKVDVVRRGTAPAVAAPPAAPVTPGAPAAGAAIDINTADQPALETIPGIGPVKAAAILQFRTEQGSFTSIEQLLEVTGIGPATLEAIRPYVTL